MPSQYRTVRVVQKLQRGEWIDLHTTEYTGEARVCRDAYRETYPDQFYRVIGRQEIVVPETFSELVQREAKTSMLSKLASGALGEELKRLAQQALKP